MSLTRLLSSCVSRSRYPSFQELSLCRLFSTGHQQTSSEDLFDGEVEETKNRFSATIDPEVGEAIDGGLKPRKNSGRRRIAAVMLPTYLEMAAKRAVSRYLNQSFREEVTKLENKTHHMELPEEPEDVIRRKRDATEKVIAREPPVEWSTLTEDEREFILTKRKRKINDVLSGTKPNWKDISYDDLKAHVYVGARLAPTYAALKYVMNDIKLSDPMFRPKTLFDFGSGPGTTMFAANEIWPNSISEHFNVDVSQAMNDLSTFLLRGGKEENPMIYNGVYHREYLPLSSTIKYDLVVSAFTLMELPSRAARVHAIESLWQKTSDLLVIVEHGSKPGFSVVNEARSLILDMTGHDATNSFYETSESDTKVKAYDWRDAPTSHILAPCPHHMSCPKMFSKGPILCNFIVNYFPLDLGFDRGTESERFSFVVLRKGKQDAQRPSWPRINQEVLKKSGHIICRMCCPDGGHKSVTFTKSKHSGHVYKCARAAEWGDLFPAVITEEERPLSFWDKLKKQRRHELETRNRKEDDDDFQ